MERLRCRHHSQTRTSRVAGPALCWQIPRADQGSFGEGVLAEWPGRNDSLAALSGDRSDEIDVGVVVEDDRPEILGGSGYQEVWDLEVPLAASAQQALDLEDVLRPESTEALTGTLRSVPTSCVLTRAEALHAGEGRPPGRGAEVPALHGHPGWSGEWRRERLWGRSARDLARYGRLPHPARPRAPRMREVGVTADTSKRRDRGRMPNIPQRDVSYPADRPIPFRSSGTLRGLDEVAPRAAPTSVVS